MQFSENNLEITASSNTEVELLNDTVTAYLASDANVPDLLTKLLDLNPEMPMALCLQGYLLKLAAHPRFNPAIESFLARARAIRSQASPREQRHIDALAAWQTG